MFFCVFYVHDGASRFRINKSTTKSYLQTPEVQSRSGNPKWDCFEEFPVKTEKDYLTIKVFRDRTKLGRINIPAWEIPLDKGQTFTLPLNSKPKRALAPTFRDAKEGSVQLETYVSKHEAFQLPPHGPKRDKFIQGYFKAMSNIKDVALLSTGSAATAASAVLNDNDNNEAAILTFLPTSSPTASRTKVHIRGRGLGKSKSDIKSIHICGLDVTATLEHLNSTSLKVTTSFWKESVGKIKIVFMDGTVIESSETFEFLGRDNDVNSLVPGHTRPSQTSIYTEFVPRTNSSVSGGGGSEYHGSSKRDSMQAFTGEIDFPHHEHILERGTDDEMRQNYQVLIGHAKVQQEHLVDSMRHREKLMMVIIEEAPHLMAKTQDVKRKTSGRATRERTKRKNSKISLEPTIELDEISSTSSSSSSSSSSITEFEGSIKSSHISKKSRRKSESSTKKYRRVRRKVIPADQKSKNHPSRHASPSNKAVNKGDRESTPKTKKRTSIACMNKKPIKIDRKKENPKNGSNKASSKNTAPKSTVAKSTENDKNSSKDSRKIVQKTKKSTNTNDKDARSKGSQTFRSLPFVPSKKKSKKTEKYSDLEVIKEKRRNTKVSVDS
ncbi:uncharacterized protein LOC134841973 isoform X2 [Symsagittifera roscoffensis]|uniref:uncharacterized protein LOC134841973 isoform X2 n=1 Tax=Symsagittifera roscoffensis TaxID=84072 RepID=UPI00307C23E7